MMKKWPILAIVSCMMFGCSDDKTKVINPGGYGGSGNPSNPSSPGDPTKPDNNKPGTPSDPDQNGNKPQDCTGIDLMTSKDNCGVCGRSCGLYGSCNAGKCECQAGTSDCDGNGTCETKGECECHKGDTLECYEGPEETQNVGICRGGYYECEFDEMFGSGWSFECKGQVLPEKVITCQAGNPMRDGDCNGVPDSQQDDDGDGYTICGSLGEKLDCCDNSMACGSAYPQLVNPGKMLDCKGNNIDDDCDGEVDEDDIDCNGSGGGSEACVNMPIDCGNVMNLGSWRSDVEDGNFGYIGSQAAHKLSQAMDMCIDDSGKYGRIIEYSLTRSSLDGPSYNKIAPEQASVLNEMSSMDGSVKIMPRVGNTFAILSTGYARDARNNPDYNAEWSEIGNAVPKVYLEKHENKLVSHPACGSSNARINDSVVLHLKMQAPSYAKGISFDFRFFSFEYPYYVCTAYNDFFMTIMTDEYGRPMADTNGDGSLDDEDGNISFDKEGNAVSVNNAFFTTCVAPSCFDAKAFYHMNSMSGCWRNASCSNNHCGVCDADYRDVYAFSENPYLGEGYGNTNVGGGTGWLQTKAPVKPGQVFNLDFYIWDTDDAKYDSTVILDNFRWLCDETSVGTDFAPPVIEFN